MSEHRISFAQLDMRAAAGAGTRLAILPLANVFVALVPFLLLASSLTPLAAAPLNPAGSGEPAAAGRPRVTLHLRPAQVQVTVQNGRPEARRFVINVPRGADNTAAGLRAGVIEACGRVQDRFGQLDTATLLADDSIPYEEVVAILDVLRDDGPRTPGGAHAALFSNVVLGSGSP